MITDGCLSRARKQLSDDVEDAYWNWIYTLNDIRSGNNGCVLFNSDMNSQF